MTAAVAAAVSREIDGLEPDPAAGIVPEAAMKTWCRPMSASSLAYLAAGCPSHGYARVPVQGCCATCGAPLNHGVPLTEIETPTTANHADYFRFGSRHVCDACAWLYGVGKGRPGNYLATPGRYESTVISLESVVEDKRPWLTVLRELPSLAPATPVAGVMTTDVKPRLWPRVRLATIGAFGLYLHCPDYDVSEWRAFDLASCLTAVDLMIPPLTAGFAKASLYHGLWRDHARASRDPMQTAAWEAALSAHRAAPYYLPAVIAAGVTKEMKRDVKQPGRPAVDTHPAATRGDQHRPTQLGLF